MNELREAVILQYPALKDVFVEMFQGDEFGRPEYSGAAFVVTRENVPKILMALSGPEHVKYLMEMRPTAIELVAEGLGVAPEDITPELLEAFIFLHEYGHAKDYLTNYRGESDNATHSHEEAIQEWNEHYKASLLSLPVPGFDPSDLRTEVTACGGVQAFYEQHPNLVNPHGITPLTQDDLFREQEMAYRNLPHEKYADDFAYTLLASQQASAQTASH
jgi:hypothetical protein